MLKGLSQASDLPPLLSVEQACKLLGVSRSVGYRAAASGDLPTLRWGRRVYVPTARLLELLGLPAEEKAGCEAASANAAAPTPTGWISARTQ
jgi:excisionase family DNA binding protein